MFRKLVSNLPFSPSLINQVGFYSKRLKKEQFTRKFGLIFTILAIIVQSITFLAPAKASLAANANDIMYGGDNHGKTSMARTLASGCDSLGRCDLAKIYSAYGITAANLAAGTPTTIYSSTANNYWSTGRAPRGYGGETSVQIPGGPIIYSRTLAGWAANVNWSAIKVNTAQGVRWVLTDCGNIVTQEGQKPTPKPDISVTKTVDKSIVNKGGKVTFTITVTNIGKAIAKNLLVYDNAPIGINLQNTGLEIDPLKSPQRWETHKRFDMAPGQSYTYKIVAIITKTGPATLTNKACADIVDSNAQNNCDTATVTVNPPCPIPGKENLAKDDPLCKTNPGLIIEKTSDTKTPKVGDTFIYTLKVTNKGDVDLPKVVVRDVAPDQVELIEAKQPGEKVFTTITNKHDFTSKNFSLAKGQSVLFEIRAKAVQASAQEVINQACALSVGSTTTAGSCANTSITIPETCATNPLLAKDDSNCQPPCSVPGKENVPSTDSSCKACDQTKVDQNGSDISCLELHKKARNVTQQIQNANGTKANPGDSIEYTLSVKNLSKQERKGFVMEENMEDVLEYADIIDASGAQFTEKPVRMLSWAPVDIQPNETISRTILIKIKSPLPSTPASTSDPLSHDMKLVNVYGDTVVIDLPSNPIKTVEHTVSVLPSTGTGTNVFISTMLIATVVYFYFRNRLMVKELGLVRQQFNYSAGV